MKAGEGEGGWNVREASALGTWLRGKREKKRLIEKMWGWETEDEGNSR
jgi:hypothetical protein